MAEVQDEMTNKVRALAKEAWAQLKDTKGWSSHQISMPLPQRWNGSPTAIVWHLYADRMKPGLMDAVEVSHPWGYVELEPEPDAKPVVHTLSSQLEALGYQGVRPLKADELKDDPSEKPLWQELRTGVGTPEVKKRAKQWSSLNGTIFAAIAPHHPEFVHWLNA
jgi:hypothetical protein